MKARFVSILGLALVASSALAITPSSFVNSYSVFGVNLTQGAGNAFDLSVDAGATFSDGITTSAIKDVFGVYAFAIGGGYFTNEPGSMSTPPTNWGFVNDDLNVPKVGKFEDLVGYDNTSKSNSLKPGGSPLTFSFTTTNAGPLAVTSALSYGVHVRLNNDKTYFVATGAPQAVPEPTTMAALGFGALGLLKRRKKA